MAGEVISLLSLWSLQDFSYSPQWLAHNPLSFINSTLLNVHHQFITLNWSSNGNLPNVGGPAGIINWEKAAKASVCIQGNVPAFQSAFQREHHCLLKISPFSSVEWEGLLSNAHLPLFSTTISCVFSWCEKSFNVLIKSRDCSGLQGDTVQLGDYFLVC